MLEGVHSQVISEHVESICWWFRTHSTRTRQRAPRIYRTPTTHRGDYSSTTRRVPPVYHYCSLQGYNLSCHALPAPLPMTCTPITAVLSQSSQLVPHSMSFHVRLPSIHVLPLRSGWAIFDCWVHLELSSFNCCRAAVSTAFIYRLSGDPISVIKTP